MSYKKFNICRAESYQGKDGQQKTRWDTVGTLVEFEKQDGSISRIVEIPAIGLKASVFEQKAREQQGGGGGGGESAKVLRYALPRAGADIEYPQEEVDPNDIPF